MYSLLSGLYKYCTQKDEYILLILGLDNAGKSTYLEAAKSVFSGDQQRWINTAKISTTVGLSIGRVSAAGVVVNFWDLGGQTELQSFWDKYYTECHGIVYVVDSADRDRMQESKQVFDSVIGCEQLVGVPLLVLANKQDLTDCMGVREVKPIFHQSDHLIGRRDFMVIPVSALNGDGVKEGIEWLVQCCKHNAVLRPPRQDR